MNSDASTELAVYKPAQPDAANTPLALEAHNAIRLSGSQGLYRPTSSEHLPLVSLSENGKSESIQISRGRLFSASLVDGDRAILPTITSG